MYLVKNHVIFFSNYSAGREHGVGIFVSLVSRGSQADIVGLKVLTVSFTCRPMAYFYV